MTLISKNNAATMALLVLLLLAGGGACTSEKGPGSTATTPPVASAQQQPGENGTNPGTQPTVDPAGSGPVDTTSGAGQESALGDLLGGGGGFPEAQMPGGAAGPGGAGGSPNQVIYRDAQTFGLFVSPVQNEKGRDVAFSCPGDSFLTGEISKFDKLKSDRIYSFECTFFQNGVGKPMRKTNCSLSTTLTGNMINYTCPDGKFLSGQHSIYEGSGKNRNFQYECCEMKGPDDEKVSVAKTESATGQPKDLCTNDQDAVRSQFRTLPDYQPFINIDVNERRTDLTYSCHKSALLENGLLQTNFEMKPVENAVMKSVRVDYDPSSATKDASHSFFCCGLMAE